MKVSVTELAHFIHRRGDIHFRYDRNVEPAEGIRAQKALQGSRPEGYLREVVLSLELEGEPGHLVGPLLQSMPKLIEPWRHLVPVLDQLPHILPEDVCATNAEPLTNLIQLLSQKA